MLTKILQKIGLSEKDADVYLACLELGTQPASIIAKKAGLKRPTTYMILEELQRKGLVSEYTGANVKYFTAASPEYLLTYVEKQRRDMTQHQNELEHYLPHLQALTNPYAMQPKVKFFEGVEGIERVVTDTLNAKGVLRTYSSVDAWFSKPELRRFTLWYAKQRVLVKKIPLYCICPDTQLARKYIEEDYVDNRSNSKLSHFRWLPKQIQNITNQINIYDNKMSIACISRNEKLGIILESQSIADTQKTIFDATWLSSFASNRGDPESTPFGLI